ncbi:hypothetical protein ACO0LF_27810 [Undibacterium sp. Di27W]|uniref:hypothetical protein n=1 Tax=Undibacterium sp. Di27W TaxID=3413036 RepID=UPI003BF1CD74
MQLNISLVSDFHYTSEIRKFPINIEITSDDPVDICYPVHVTGAVLTKLDNSELWFGYAMQVTPAKRNVITLTSAIPLRMQADVFEHDDDFGDLIPGEYLCEIKVSVVTIVDDKACAGDLRESFTIMLT